MTQLANAPVMSHQLNTTRDPNDPSGTDTWVDVTSYVHAQIGQTTVTIKRGRPDELSAVAAGQMTWVLDNLDGRFDPTNTSGAYYPNLRGWRQAKTLATWGTNVLANPAFASASTTGWSATGTGAAIAAVAHSSTASWWANGTGNLGKVTTSSGSATSITVKTPTGAASPSQVWQGVCPIQPPAGTTATVAVEFLNVSNASLGIGSTVTVTGSASTPMTRAVTPTFTAPASTTQVRLSIVFNALTSTAPGYVGAAKAERTDNGLATGVYDPGSTQYPLFYGYEETFWPQTYRNNGTYPVCTPSFVDAFAALSRITLDECVINEMLADAPTALYPLNDGGGLSAGNIGATKQPNATITTSKNGTGSLGGAGFIPAYTGTCMVTGHASGGGTGDGGMLSVPLKVPAGGTIELWFASTDKAGAYLATIGDAATTTQEVQILLDSSDGHIKVFYQQSPGNFSTEAYTGTNFADGGAHCLIVTLPTSGTQRTVSYIDGTALNSYTTAGSFSGYYDGSGIYSVGALRTNGSANGSAIGSYALAAIYPTLLSNARALAHASAGLNGFLGDTVGGRVTRLLSYGAWLVARQTIDTSSVGDIDTPLQGASGLSQDSNLLDSLKKAVDSAEGDLDVTTTGNVRYRSRDYRLLQTAPTWVFGENESLGELPYSDLPAGIASKPDKLYSVVQVQQKNGITVNSANSISELRYFPTVLQKTGVLLQNPEHCIDLRDDLLRRYKDPLGRVTSITLDPASNPQLWPAVLSLDFGQRVRVMRRAPGTGATKQVECYVESVQHDIGTGSWKTTVTTSPVQPYNAWILGDATYGVLGTTTIPCF